MADGIVKWRNDETDTKILSVLSYDMREWLDLNLAKIYVDMQYNGQSVIDDSYTVDCLVRRLKKQGFVIKD